jgi:acyl-coenzyme A thioesterase PaaI-like protein|tara:strand:- start:483 stop:779 length:297 start_codon:yes stop_codon:yes gene_type:complete
MVYSMADIAIGHNVGLALADAAGGAPRKSGRGVPRAPITTVSLGTDFVGTARPGDWVETRVGVQKAGHTLAFANAYLVCGEQRIARASAVFRILGNRG